MSEIQKQIGDVLEDRPAARVNINSSVADAMEIIESCQSDCVLIFDEHKVKGIFTSRDFLHRVVAEKRLPADTAICDVMTPDPELLNHTDCISYAIERMATCGFRNIAIATDSDRIAMLSVWSVMAHLSEVLNEVQESRQEQDDEILDEMTDLGGG